MLGHHQLTPQPLDQAHTRAVSHTATLPPLGDLRAAALEMEIKQSSKHRMLPQKVSHTPISIP